ncbi:MAG: leucyl/phenylalanyl-tRNA--protein transferase [Melioribacteraceae bacterium]|nr:leucyl/phenylalanyl-tRNA--protein transferase [Melioribacteraceae bacterium]MCF8354768.1 leucyl/phenylalanyl-tRNA--protein transferase [Melioribacteraceae bacterium]MCF8394393.1 leucyl/phenylalanyl-tRNA--protein transferase [Melioribacteraceae bacterium]MCF8417511.1 leucyl/phenylalanyl-tRNA--protein transferase [Melioribacteraceae bacterium]
MSFRDEINPDELLKPQIMLFLYTKGAFPMANDSGEVHWYMPEIRTIIPLDDYNFPRSLRKVMKESGFEYRYDLNQLEIIRACADRDRTWISDQLIDAYKSLIDSDNLHSVEVYKDKKLAGGLYGITYRGAFFGESMFSYISQSSKAALIKLIQHLNKRGFVLLDVQFITNHLKMFGAREISLDKFNSILQKALSKTGVTFQ